MVSNLLEDFVDNIKSYIGSVPLTLINVAYSDILNWVLRPTQAD